MIKKILDAVCWALAGIMLLGALALLAHNWIESEIQPCQYQRIADWAKDRPALKEEADRFLNDDKLTQNEYRILLHRIDEIDQAAAINSIKQ